MLLLKIVELKIVEKIYNKLSDKGDNKKLRVVIAVVLYAIITVLILDTAFYLNDMRVMENHELHRSSEYAGGNGQVITCCECFSPSTWSINRFIVIITDIITTIISFIISFSKLLYEKIKRKRKRV